MYFMEQEKYSSTTDFARKVRKDIVNMTYKAGTTGAHIGGSLSAVEILCTLYSHVLRFKKSDMMDPYRDRLVFSKGHAAMALYSVLYHIGILPKTEFESFKENGSFIASHPHEDIRYGIEFSSGSLGLGLSQGVGMAIGMKMRNIDSNVYVFQGDGECEEGSVWEAAMSAANYKLDNLILIVDTNKLQLDGPIDDIMSLGNFAAKWEAFGWNVIEVDGHNIEALDTVMKVAAKHSNDKPTVIIAHTIKGKGISFIENEPQWHVGMLNSKLYSKAIEELENGTE